MSNYNKRYKHWFWNSRVMVYLSLRLAKFQGWLWRKMYN